MTTSTFMMMSIIPTTTTALERSYTAIFTTTCLSSTIIPMSLRSIIAMSITGPRKPSRKMNRRPAWSSNPKLVTRDLVPLIKSPTEDLPQDTQQNESEAKNEDS